MTATFPIRTNGHRTKKKKNYSINLNARPSILHYTSNTPLRYGRKVTHVVLFFSVPP